MDPRTPSEAVRLHWREYAIEGAALGLFMVSVGAFASLLEAPGSPIRQAIPDPLMRRAGMGAAMGATAMALIYSPWGQRSGAHMNPAVTLTFFRLGKIAAWDALFYVLAQTVGGLIGVVLAGAAFGSAFTAPPVAWAVTTPGARGAGAAFAAEVAIAFGLMTAVLVLSNSRFARFTGVAAGGLVALFIVLESPLSGMGLNPARSLASALPARVDSSLWIYLTAPPLGMLAAAESYRAARGAGAVLCAKLHHTDEHACIFRCGYCRHEPGETG